MDDPASSDRHDCSGLCEESARLRIALAKALRETEIGLPCGDTLRLALGLQPEFPIRARPEGLRRPPEGLRPARSPG